MAGRRRAGRSAVRSATWSTGRSGRATGSSAARWSTSSTSSGGRSSTWPTPASWWAPSCWSCRQPRSGRDDQADGGETGVDGRSCRAALDGERLDRVVAMRHRRAAGPRPRRWSTAAPSRVGGRAVTARSAPGRARATCSRSTCPTAAGDRGLDARPRRRRARRPRGRRRRGGRQARRPRRAPRCRPAAPARWCTGCWPATRSIAAVGRARPARHRPPPRQGHVRAAGGGPHAGRLRRAGGAARRPRGRAALPRPGVGRGRARRPAWSTPPSAARGRDPHPHGGQPAGQARPAPATRCVHALRRAGAGDRAAPAGWRPGAPTRSGSTWPPSATPWSATTATAARRPVAAAARGRSCTPPQLASTTRVTGEPLSFDVARCRPTWPARRSAAPGAEPDRRRRVGEPTGSAGPGGARPGPWRRCRRA